MRIFSLFHFFNGRVYEHWRNVIKKMALVSRKFSEMVASMWGGITWKTSIFIFQTNSIIQLS